MQFIEVIHLYQNSASIFRVEEVSVSKLQMCNLLPKEDHHMRFYIFMKMNTQTTIF
jgi:hypothetical protein